MPQELNGFNDFVSETMNGWSVPGLAIAIVKDGKVVFSEGFGRRNLEKDMPVTPETIFAIASSTKAFTSMSLGILVDEGKLEWDRPIREYLPAFRLHDSLASERTTSRDLLTHRTGLPRHDLMWYNSSLSRQEIFDRLRYLVPSKDFRSCFQYQNLMYMTAGYLVGELSGRTWEEFVQERIFNPLEMATSSLSVRDSQQASDFALPYIKKDDEVKETPFRNIDAVGPGGAINSSVSDIANWLLLHLGEGRYRGKQIISQGNLIQMHSPQMVIQEMVQSLAAFTKYDEVGHASYGMGWFVQTYRGHNIVHHGGNIDGFSSLVSFMPQQDIGMVVLTNLGGNPLSTIISYNVFDRWIGLDQIPWSRRIKEESDKQKEAASQAKDKSSTDRKSETRPSHPLEDYTGEFDHPGYGVVSIAVKDDCLEASYNSMPLSLEHYHYDIFEMVHEPFDMRMKVSFFTDVKGNIGSIAIPMEPAVEEAVFTRIPDRNMRGKPFLQNFAGEYELYGKSVIVSLNGDDTLVVSIPGQPEYELVPYRGREFTLKGLRGFSVEFRQDEAGVIYEAIVTQPNAMFTARKK